MPPPPGFYLEAIDERHQAYGAAITAWLASLGHQYSGLRGSDWIVVQRTYREVSSVSWISRLVLASVCVKTGSRAGRARAGALTLAVAAWAYHTRSP